MSDGTMTPAYLVEQADLHAIKPREAALQWFRHARYGLFLHYGLYSILGRHEWVQYAEAIRPAEYAQLAHYFTAERFDAQAIADLAVDGGMKYINLTTRHHDCFCLFRTRQTSFNSVDAAPARRDLVAELADACRTRGLGLCLYYSHGRDWKHPHAPDSLHWDDTARPAYDPPERSYADGSPAHDLSLYLDFMSAQIEELLTQYGPVAAIWLDGIRTPLTPNGPDGKPREGYDPRTDGDPFRCQELYDLVHRLQPQCLVSYKQGYLGTEDFFAPEHRAYNRFGQSFAEVPGEVCTTLIKEPLSWGYHGPNVVHRDESEVWEALANAGRNQCNLLLNTGPKPDGSIEPRHREIIRNIGRRLSQHGFPQGGA